MGQKHYRVWWQKPKRYAEQEEERKVSFLELFYDLVYVVIIAQLSHRLAEDISWTQFLEFTFLFMVVWWGWFNGAIYHDLHGNDDIKTRVITFLQMFAVAGMAVYIHDAFGEGAVGFAVSYSAYLLIITVLWYRTGYHDPDHRPLSTPYSLFYLISIVVVVLSVFFAPPVRFYLWYASFFLILVQPLILYSFGRMNAWIKAQLDRSAGLSPSIIERFGLLTIIVLGEVITGVVTGLTQGHGLEPVSGITAFLLMSMGIGIWWVYFDYISNQKPKDNRTVESLWGYLHMPLTLGITAAGAAVINITEAGHDHIQTALLLLTGGLALVYATISIMFFTLRSDKTTRKLNRTGQVVTALAAVLSLVLYFLKLDILLTLILLDLIILAPVYFGFRVWLIQHLRTMDHNL